MNTEKIEIHVLHVDDPDFAALTGAFLERAVDRINLQVASDPEAGLALLEEEGFDCIISDYDLPGMDGIEFLEAVREVQPDLPFILFTGKGSEEVASEAINAGVTNYLQKGSGTEKFEILANEIVLSVKKQRTEQELKQLRRQYTQLVEQNFVGIYIIQHNEFVYANPRLAEIHGFGSPEEIIGKSPLELVAPSERDLVQNHLEQRISGEKQEIQYQTKGLRKDGEQIEIELHGSRIEYEGKPAVIGAELDVTERTEHEEELRNRTKQLQDVMDTVEGAMWIRNKAGEYMYMNQYHRDLFDIDDDVEVAGKRFTDLLPADVAKQFQENDQRVYETEEPVEIEETVETNDGPIHFLTRIVPLFENGSVYATCGIATDVTEQRNRERQLEQFANIVSHDLRNPLNVASGRLELASEECESDHLDAIERAHERMAMLIDDLLTLARAGEVIADTTSVSLDSLINRCWVNVETNDATLVDDIERTVQADESRLEQVFENLIRNAIEHGGTDVTVTIGTLADGFYVEDDGPSISPDAREAIFETGYSTTEDGTGFGLSIVKQIVEAHGWSLRVTEGTDGGARFEVTGVEFVAD